MVIASSNTNHEYAHYNTTTSTGDTVTLTFVPDEANLLSGEGYIRSADGTDRVTKAALAMTSWSQNTQLRFSTLSGTTYDGAVTYSVKLTDWAGNTDTFVTTTDSSKVTIDNTKPNLTSMVIASSNTNHEYAHYNTTTSTGDTVTLTFVPDEANLLSGEGYIRSADGTDRVTKAALTMTSGSQNAELSFSTLSGTTYDGAVTYSVKLTDWAGNTDTFVTTTDSSKVTIDNTKPKLTSMVIASSNTNHEYAHYNTTTSTGDTVTLTFVPDEANLLSGEGYIRSADGTDRVTKAALAMTSGSQNAELSFSTLSGTTYDGAVTYSVKLTDWAGNTDTFVTTTDSSKVTIDNTKPKLTSMVIASSNTNHEYAHYNTTTSTGDTVTLTFVPDEANLLSGEGYIRSADGTDRVTKAALAMTSWSQNTQLRFSTLSGTTYDGAVTYSVKLTDWAGNTDTFVTTTDSSKVTIDNTKPNLTSMVIASSNTNHEYAHYNTTTSTGDTVTLTFVPDEANLLSGEGYIRSADGTDRVTKAALTMTSGSQNAELSFSTLSGTTYDGAVTYSVKLTDWAGNTDTFVTTTDSSKVTIDNTKPKLTSMVIASSNTNHEYAHYNTTTSTGDTVTLTFVPDEANLLSGEGYIRSADGTDRVTKAALAMTSGSQNAELSFSTLSGTTYDGAVTYSVKLTDWAGNTDTFVTTTDSSKVTIDNTKPKLTSMVIASSNTNHEYAHYNTTTSTGDTVTLTFVPDEANLLSGEGYIRSADGTDRVTKAALTMTSGSQNTELSFSTLSGTTYDGAVTYSVKLTDWAGNTDTFVTTTDSSKVTIDNTKPKLTSMVIASSNTNHEYAHYNTTTSTGDTVTLTFVPDEANLLSGEGYIRSADGTDRVTKAALAMTSGSQNAELSFSTLSGTTYDGAVTYSVKLTDWAGNTDTFVTTTDSSKVTIDNTKPKLTSMVIA